MIIGGSRKEITLILVFISINHSINQGLYMPVMSTITWKNSKNRTNDFMPFTSEGLTNYR
jgi:hypothetical protein